MKNRLTLKQTIITASTLFGLFFGAGNLIFPVHLGQIAGSSFIPATVGFIVTAVTIPILAVAAIGITHSDGLQELASKVSRGYGIFFTALLYLTIGPFFAIPRCATTSFTTGLAPMLSEESPQGLILLIFSFAFFAAVMYLSLHPNKIMDWVGKVINPAFLLFLFVLIIASLSSPSAAVSEVAPAAAYEKTAFVSAFIEGYGTMDAIAGLAFGILIIEIIRDLGVKDDDDIAKDVLKSGLFAGLLMAVIYVLTILMGTQSRGLFEVSDNGGIALAQISGHYLGSAGSLVLALTITLACLKTSVGLVASCARTFEKMFPKGPKYNTWAVIFTVFSFAVSNVGLTAIITWAVPVLMFLYPLAITLILLALTGKKFGHDRTVYRCVTAFTVVPAFIDLLGALPQGAAEAVGAPAITGFFAKLLPLSGLGLGWVVPAIAGFAAGLIIRRSRKA